MTRSSLLLAAITLSCGTLLGWGGAMTIGRFRAAPDAPVESDVVMQSRHFNAEDEPLIVRSREPDASISVELPARHPTPTIVVGVNGAVKRPGVYYFDEDSRVQDGIRAADGVTEEADLDDINIAARLIDNTSLYIPFRVFRQQEQHALVARRTLSAAESNPARYTRSGWAQGIPAGVSQQGSMPDSSTPDTAPTTTSSPATSGLINLNHATLDELQRLPGVGPKTAEKIDAYRQAQPFRTVDELEAVHGIGEKRMEALRDLVTVE